jgi:flavin-dependent dehydrogenase
MNENELRNDKRTAVNRVAVIGGGPAGCTIATLLAEKGIEVTLFADGERPELIVGESTLPAMVPTLRRLGIEEEVAATSVLKPGASFVFRDQQFVQFCFTSVEGQLPTYAYNIDRTVFDGLISKRADEAGVRRVTRCAGVVVEAEDRLALDADSLAAAGGAYARGEQPDLLIDATGRTRLFSRALKVPTEVGARKDVAYFAHFEDFEESFEPRGQAVIGVLENGWSWQIPLPGGRTSVGIVLNKEEAKKLGDTPEERLEKVVHSDPQLSGNATKARRVSSVMTYTNYQLISERGSGSNWFTVGDAFGFVDPMLSPGLLLAMKSAENLADGLLAFRAGDLPFAVVCRQHESEMTRQLEAWGEYVGRYYNGEIFAMQRSGKSFFEKFNFWPNPVISAWIEKQVGTMAAGANISRPFNRRLIRFLCRFFPCRISPEQLAIR